MNLIDFPGWRLVHGDDFSSWSPSRYFVYPQGWPDTSGNGVQTPSIISASGGLLNIHLGTVNGVHQVAAFCPLLPNSLSGPPEGGNRGDQLGMRYAFRIRADAMPGYKGVPLLWPRSSDGMRDGEIDCPESDFNNVDRTGQPRSPMAFMHRANAVDGDDQDWFETPAGTTWQDWHTYAVEWVPGVSVTYFMDGGLIGRSTNRVPNTPMHLVMQFETTLYGFAPDPSVGGNVQLDWLRVWART